MTLYFQEIPSLVALIFKAVLIGYAARSDARNLVTRVFLALLVLLSVFNLIELSGIHYYYSRNREFDAIVASFGYAYFATFIPIAAIILHVSLALSVDPAGRESWNRLYWLVYLPVIPLEYLLFVSNNLIAGFVPFKDSIIRDPGPLYFLFETYNVVYLSASLVNLLYGARGSRQPAITRTRNRWWLFGLMPMLLMIVYLTVADYVGWPRFTSTFFIPIGITFFLCVSTYAIHQHRLFDIEFYIPWSNVRKRKTAFYDRVRAMIAEIADLGSINQTIERLSDTLRCPVALVGGPKPVLATADGPNMVAMPIEQLRRVDHILVANEIADSMPQVHRTMRQHGVAAIVPFYPHSQNAASWLLLGDLFSEQVYSRLDFRMVEQLFDKMADLFLDKLLAMRAQLAEANAKVHNLEFRLQGAQASIVALESRVDVLARHNAQLAQLQPGDSLLSRPTQQTDSDIDIVLLGRDKSLLKHLRARFPQIEQFVGPESASFHQRCCPEVLLCAIEADGTGAQKFAQFVPEAAQQSALLLFGSGAATLAFEQRQALRGALIEVLPSDIGVEAIVRKTQALARLRQSVVDVTHADYPLIGSGAAFQQAVGEAQRLAGFREPICIRGGDSSEAIAFAAHMHQRTKTAGAFRVLHTAKLQRQEASDDASRAAEMQKLLAEAAGGALMVDNIGALSNDTWDQLLLATNEFANIRLMGACPGEHAPEKLFQPLGALVLELPSLRERRTDLPLLIHYYTLRFNLQAGTYTYLSQSDIDELMATGYPADLAALKSAVFERLRAKAAQPMSLPLPEVPIGEPDKPLEEHVAEFEMRLIEQTLKRCDGNKSKAARMLSVRPNTLHYKLERYGLLRDKK